MTHHDWVPIMVNGARRLEAVPFGLSIVDPRSGAIAWHNPAMAALLGRPVPATVAALDALGIVPAEERRQFADIGRSLGEDDSYALVDATVQRPRPLVRGHRAESASHDPRHPCACGPRWR